MAKLRTDEITETDIEEYLSAHSDFSFELRVLEELNNKGLQCLHSGTYEDPITGKSREFDIRAVLAWESKRIHLSVECKNIQKSFPLVLHCMKRKKRESFHELVYVFEPKRSRGLDFLAEFSRVVRRQPSDGLYPIGQYVAKSADQVGRRPNGEILATDGGVFEKISQAINSAEGLISQAHYLETDCPVHTLICPVLVVPDGTLWQVKYDDNGSRLGPAEQVEQVPYFVGKEWTVGDLHRITYTLSHLEIVTFSGIAGLIGRLLNKHMWLFLPRA